MKRAGTALALVALIGMVPAVASAGTRGGRKIAPGFIEGREHEVRIRPVLAKVPAEPKKLSRTERATGQRAIEQCEPTLITAVRMPTTSRDGDDPATCIVLPVGDSTNGQRLMLGRAPLTGSEIGTIIQVDTRGDNVALELELTTRGHTLWRYLSSQQPENELAFTLDGEVLDVFTLPAPNGNDTTIFTIGGRKGFPEDDAEAIEDRIEFATQEEIIELTRKVSMSRHARQLFAANAPAIEEKGTFAKDCPLPEADEAFVLGCYDRFSHTIAVLRIDRLDIISGMPVTAAHEMLHAAYDELTPGKRERVDTMIDEFLFTTPQPQLDDSLSLYSEAERSDELHSILGTEVRVLSPELERHYSRYFDDRSLVVTLSDEFSGVFDDLADRYDLLDAELDALEAQINGVEAQAIAAGDQADQLAAQIEALRAQGRFDESNALVGAQNAAVGRANALVAQYNALVAQYNATVANLNEIAQSLGELYSIVLVEPIV